MERKSNSGEWEKMKKEIHELMTEGIDYAHQLKSQLGSSSSDLESREHLAKKILESYHKSLTIMNHSGELEQVSPHIHGGGSPKSDDSDQEHHQTITSSKKSMPRWTEKVRITPGVEIDRMLDDGFSWRKYGQKDILGAKFPRGYYRCTYRKSQGCEATKQVQRSNENQMLFEISYRGIHSCSQAANVRSAIPVRVLEPDQTQGHENLEMVKESLDTDNHNYNHQPHLHQSMQYPLSSTPTLESNNMMLQLRDQNIDFFGSTSFSSDLGANVNYDYLASHNVGSVSHSTSNSPSESPFESFDPNNPFKGFGGFYS
ncbi:putative WRKY transcription factor 30 [Raphanus sativus]|uniref:Probable WRKY transcription factor 30 n=1 Tax=Raphanus sativus TaxID=3726 RepID=A0A6J0NBW9_RAPSA|nr:probable WRKY transcription factor 30 [Raphanus sativus]KAJ4900453.1 putative WRKY transcription factor 30 [Raphanus sativus]